MSPDVRIAENARLAALHRLHILDTDYEPPFDRIVRMVADSFGVPNVGIHLLDDERQWVKAFEGLQFNCRREDSVCQFALSHDDLLLIPDLREDARTRDLGIVTGAPHLRFYAGMPLRTRDGFVIGTLCLIDLKPRPPLAESELAWLRQYAALVTETVELRVDYHRSQQELRRAVEFDPLTGLRNRLSLIREGQQLLDAAPAPAGVAALQVRLDRMSVVLGATGQQGNSAALHAAAERLSSMVGPEDILGRGDGNSFIVLRVRHLAAESLPLADWLDATAERVLARLAEPMVIEDQQLAISASIGLASFADGTPVHHVIEAAEAASLSSRSSGGNQSQHFAPGAFAEMRERVGVERDLREAVAQRTFAVYYQPVVDMAAENRIVGAEALVRWPRGDGPPIGPDRFIPLAEETGLIYQMGLQVFDQACQDLAAWQAQGLALWVSVNISPLQLADPQLADKLAARATAAGVDCACLKLEITESALTMDIDDVMHALQRLRAAGFGLSLDDFGTGHSSLARLIRMPFGSIKVDRGFVNDCPAGPGAAVVRSVAALARELNMMLVAEGVEDDVHERFLRENGYRLAQGFRYGRAMTSQAMGERLASGPS